MVKTKYPPFIKANQDKINFTKLDAARELQKLDHCFLYPWAVKVIGKPFGYYEVYAEVDTRSQHKGLHCPDVKEGDKVMGNDAMSVAMGICKKEGIEYNSFFGRGSQLAECTQRLINHYSGKKQNPIDED